MRIKTLVATGAAVLTAIAAPAAASAAAGPPSSAPAAGFASHATAPVALSALASAGCNRNGPTVTNYAGVRYTTRYCHNYRGGVVGFGSLGRPATSSAGRHFYLGVRLPERGPAAEPAAVGDARRYSIWLYTQPVP